MSDLIQKEQINFDVGLNDSNTINTNCVICTQDINSTIFDLEIRKNNIVFNKVTVLFVGEETNVLVDAEKDNSLWFVEFKTEWIKSFDNIKAYVYAYVDDKGYDVGSFKFKVDVSEVDATIRDVEVVYWKRVDDLIEEFKEKLKTDDFKGEPGKQGEPGKDGLSAFQIAQLNGFSGTEEDWLASLDGKKGEQGESGTNGLSAYQIAQSKGFSGTEEEWLKSLDGEQGKQGDSAYEIAVKNGFSGTKSEWLKSLEGEPGKDGESAYQEALDNGFVGDESEWLNSLIGKQGEPGKDGLNGDSAYQLAVQKGYTGTLDEWLASLEGPQGEPGTATKLYEAWTNDKQVLSHFKDVQNVMNRRESILPYTFFNTNKKDPNYTSTRLKVVDNDGIIAASRIASGNLYILTNTQNVSNYTSSSSLIDTSFAKAAVGNFVCFSFDYLQESGVFPTSHSLQIWKIKQNSGNITREVSTKTSSLFEKKLDNGYSRIWISTIVEANDIDYTLEISNSNFSTTINDDNNLSITNFSAIVSTNNHYYYGDTPPFLSNKNDDVVNSFFKYHGISTKDSSDAKDYIWSYSDEYIQYLINNK